MLPRSVLAQDVNHLLNKLKHSCVVYDVLESVTLAKKPSYNITVLHHTLGSNCVAQSWDQEYVWEWQEWWFPIRGVNVGITCGATSAEDHKVFETSPQAEKKKTGLLECAIEKHKIIGPKVDIYQSILVRQMRNLNHVTRRYDGTPEISDDIHIHTSTK